MAFQITQLSYDFHSGMGIVTINEQPIPPAMGFKNVTASFQLKPTPAGGTPDAATEAELKAEAKAILLAAAAAL